MGRGGDPGGFRWPPRDDAGAAQDAGPGGPEPRQEQRGDEAGRVGAGRGYSSGSGSAGAVRASGSVSEPFGWLARLELGLLGGGGGVSLAGWEPAAQGRLCFRCGAIVGAGEVGVGGCGGCRRLRLLWDRAVCLGPYEGRLREAIMACKYHGDRGAGRRVGRLLGERAAGELAGRRPEEGVAVVPVPTTLRRRLSNHGLDHSGLLARAVADSVGAGVCRWLGRTHGPRLAGSSVTARAEAVRGMIRPGVPAVTGRPGLVLLVDDVRTTGATATACIRQLRTLLGQDSGRSRSGGSGSGAGGDETRYWLVTAAVTAKGRRSGAAAGVVSGGGNAEKRAEI